MYGHIYKVKFRDGQEAFFTSLSAIYDIYTPEQIGCKVGNLWNRRVRAGNPYKGKRCTITREVLVAKANITGK